MVKPKSPTSNWVTSHEWAARSGSAYMTNSLTGLFDRADLQLGSMRHGDSIVAKAVFLRVAPAASKPSFRASA
jgi:hypothetical protein